MNRIKILILLVCFSYSALASDKGDQLLSGAFKPSHLKFQFAGNIGFVSGGFGYTTFGGKLYNDILIGYVPKSVANSTIVHLVQKNTFRARNFRVEKLRNFYPTLGFAISVETGRNSFLSIPSNYPEGYYGTNALTFPLFAGITYQSKMINSKHIHQVEYYAEINTLATYAYYNFIRKEYFNPDILSLSLGINIKLN